MIEYVFRRKRDGKLSEYWIGRYSLKRGEKPREVHLGLKDEAAARAALREHITEAQRELYGLLPKKSYREAAAANIGLLISEYEADLKAQARKKMHVHDTISRVRVIVGACKWQRLGDISAPRFLQWRATLDRSPKTRKEYQVSLNAFLNWLVDSERLERNPIKKVPMPETRGQQVRVKRAATLDELAAIFGNAASEQHRLAYQLLAYTGQRLKEIGSLVWGDLHLDGDRPFVVIRENTTKDKKRRAVPLHPRLAAAVMEFHGKAGNARPDAPVFSDYPDWKAFNATLRRAGIARVDAQGVRLNLHALRKTFQTMSVNAGVNQRSSQAILGHTDANLTANVYTDAAALELHREVVKLRWPGESGPSAETTKATKSRRLADILGELLVSLQSPDTQGELSTLTASQLALKMVDATGLEPVTPCV